MKPFNQRLQIRTVLKRWEKQYGDTYKEWPDKLKISKGLAKLNLSRCGAKAVDDVIGNKSWTHFMCMTCEGYKSRGVFINEDYVCLDCIKDSLDLFKNDVKLGVSK